MLHGVSDASQYQETVNRSPISIYDANALVAATVPAIQFRFYAEWKGKRTISQAEQDSTPLLLFR